MKKALAILMTVVLVFSMSFSTIAVSGKSNKGNGKSSKNFEVQKSEVQKPNAEKQKDKKPEVQKPNAEKSKDKKPETQKSNAQKKFKVELNN
jgi:anionic cell wall polymer biosynthesis LytR-Cps2A-Psr (LCP) family protein